MAPFLQVKISVVNSALGSFCWNSATDTLWQLCKWQRLLHFCRFWGFTFCYWYGGGSSYNNCASDCFCCSYTLDVSAAHMQVTVFAANMWVTIFIVIMQMGVSVAIMQVVFSAVHYAHDCFHCNYAGDSFFYSYEGDGFK